MTWTRRLLLMSTVAICADVAFASSAPGHAEEIVPVLAALVVILFGAKLGGDLATRLGQPAVVGELTFGIVLGNVDLLGISVAESIATIPTIPILAQLGVILLLFEVGLESTVRDMLKVGWQSLWVALLGIIAPFMLGWTVGAIFLPDKGTLVHVFLGAVLSATSVGITARVFQDLGRSRSPEARVILGAAVIDDVLGLIVLAVVTGIIAAYNLGLSLSVMDAGIILGKSVLFLFGALFLGLIISPRLFGVASKLRGRGVLLSIALMFCFALSYAAAQVGLAALVGAYAAGLILEETHFRDFAARGEQPLERLISPLATLLVPVFFVLMGMSVDLVVFTDVRILILAAFLTVAAILGKQACSLGVVRTKLDKLTVGIGMIPRGEVGLIFASIGLGLSLDGVPVIDQPLFSAIVIMVIVTTMITPPALKWSLNRAVRHR